MECKYCGAVYDEYKEADCPYCGAPTPKPEEDDTVKVKFKQKTYEHRRQPRSYFSAYGQIQQPRPTERSGQPLTGHCPEQWGHK